MNGLLQDKVVVVTGGASGIGRAVALRAADEGARCVVVGSLHEEPREGGVPVVDLLREQGRDARFVRTDVRSLDDIARLMAVAREAGGVDVLVTAAGVSDRVDFLEITPDRLHAVMAVNLDGTLFSCQAAARDMIDRGAPGALVTISSVGGMRGFARAATYSASKGAVRTLTYAMADALAPHGIRVNAVHPGQVDTEMLRREMGGGSPIRIPLGRKGTAEEIADVAVFAASDRASYLTGSSLVVDGGYSAVI